MTNTITDAERRKIDARTREIIAPYRAAEGLERWKEYALIVSILCNEFGISKDRAKNSIFRVSIKMNTEEHFKRIGK